VLRLVLYIFSVRLLLQESSREEVMYSSERIVSRVIDALAHRNAAVRSVADVATELSKLSRKFVSRA
jgi:hypothetical protein